MHLVWVGAVVSAAAIHSHAIRLTEQTLDNHRRNVSAAVSAVVDDEGFFIDLRTGFMSNGRRCWKSTPKQSIWEESIKGEKAE